ncbi:SAP30-binding protein [Bienertia sinuspersici]
METSTVRFTSVSSLKWSSLRPPTPQSSVLDSDLSRQRREKPSIVDYAHDDVAMSPEHEDGEYLGMSAGRVMYGEELEVTHDYSQRTPTVNIMTPKDQADSPQLPAQVDVSQPDHDMIKESEAEIGKEKINKFLAYKRHGKSFNVEVRNRKDYRNPDFLRHAVRYQDIDEIGSCFNKDVFDPHGYDKSDYFDAIETDMKREMERKEQERKRSPKVDFVSGGTQAGTGATAHKVTLPSPGISNRPAVGLQSSSADLLTREGRQNKKSKWDKVDGDRRNVLGGGQDTLSAVGAHAALLSAANAGAGYAAFTQQKRREAEERRSSDKKAERRS